MKYCISRRITAEETLKAPVLLFAADLGTEQHTPSLYSTTRCNPESFSSHCSRTDFEFILKFEKRGDLFC